MEQTGALRYIKIKKTLQRIQATEIILKVCIAEALYKSTYLPQKKEKMYTRNFTLGLMKELEKPVVLPLLLIGELHCTSLLKYNKLEFQRSQIRIF